ncbi:putative bifunctional diguanylate cyclase/phosphodiesterase [Rossellomorea aquimaris]|uniref:putative bifunctional diguanylate cyclase/phosphodiesterase n=1 Tax=Rossellomorea aquimaris TaxID=189382 RepID=UPI0007D07AED|nr:EAL domain-containing protein [Rossellomorea aquimaris]
MFKKNKLSKVLFLFLTLASLWQIDVSFLFAYTILSEQTIEFFFRLFRLGSIMVTPTLFYVAYIIVQEEFLDFRKSKWRFIMNRKSIIFFYTWSFVVYLVGWSNNGIHDLKLINTDQFFSFYFPVYGSLSWVFHTNVLLFGLSIIVSFIISIKIHNRVLRSFLFHFILSTAVGYGIGILNMFPEARLLPSAISVLVFAISILILSNRMHLSIVRDMNNQLDQQRTFLRTVIDLNPNFIYAKDSEGRYSLVNRSYADLYGMKKDEMIGKTDLEVQTDKQMAKNTLMNDQKILSGLKGISIPEEEFVDNEGKVRWLQTSKIPITTEESTLLLGVSTDITERKQHEVELIHQANHDVLTGLPNRRLFNEDLTKVLKNTSTRDGSAAIMLIDLDRFKYINDTLGHDFGDLLLIAVSRRLETFLSTNLLPDSKVYRLGGDEFTLLFPDCHKEEAVKIADLLIEQFHGEFIIRDQEFYITPSIGISVYPEDGYDAKTLMKNADTAMYYVKEREKNSFQLFTQEMNHHFYRKMIIEKELRSALDNQEFHLHYQPLMKINTGDILGMEALLRWKNKTLGDVSPAEFIPIAEETGLILPIGEWVLKTACEQNYLWQMSGYPSLKIGVNISIRQLLDKSFVRKVATIVQESKLDPAYIDLEVTESIAMCDPELMVSKLRALKDVGVSISMDDFGTGYSSLSYLKRYPLDTLKIDRSFIRGITTHEDNKAIVKSIISMAKHLHLKVTAEGVENQDEFQFLKRSHCDVVQGYAIGHPVSAENFESNVLKGKAKKNKEV